MSRCGSDLQVIIALLQIEIGGRLQTEMNDGKFPPLGDEGFGTINAGEEFFLRLVPYRSPIPLVVDLGTFQIITLGIEECPIGVIVVILIPDPPQIPDLAHNLLVGIWILGINGGCDPRRRPGYPEIRISAYPVFRMSTVQKGVVPRVQSVKLCVNIWTFVCISCCAGQVFLR